MTFRSWAIQWYALRDSSLEGVPVELTRAVLRGEGWAGQPPTWEPSVGEYAYSPMQILGSTARDVGYRGALADLHRPSVGSRYGVAYLRRQLDRHGPGWCDVLSAYNAGRPNTGNDAYVCRAAPWCARCQV